MHSSCFLINCSGLSRAKPQSAQRKLKNIAFENPTPLDDAGCQIKFKISFYAPNFYSVHPFFAALRENWVR
jgi:hypothetical protein